MSLASVTPFCGRCRRGCICTGRRSGYISPSPPSVEQIKQLEQRLGVVLFSRANRRLTPDRRGRGLLHKTRLALEMADQAVLDAQRTARGEQERLHLGVCLQRDVRQ